MGGWANARLAAPHVRPQTARSLPPAARPELVEQLDQPFDPAEAAQPLRPFAAGRGCARRANFLQPKCGQNNDDAQCAHGCSKHEDT